MRSSDSVRVIVRDNPTFRAAEMRDGSIATVNLPRSATTRAASGCWYLQKSGFRAELAVWVADAQPVIVTATSSAARTRPSAMRGPLT